MVLQMRKKGIKIIIIKNDLGNIWFWDIYYFLLCKKKKLVDFGGELKIEDVRYDNIT